MKIDKLINEPYVDESEFWRLLSSNETYGRDREWWLTFFLNIPRVRMDFFTQDNFHKISDNIDEIESDILAGIYYQSLTRQPLIQGYVPTMAEFESFSYGRKVSALCLAGRSEEINNYLKDKNLIHLIANCSLDILKPYY